MTLKFDENDTLQVKTEAEAELVIIKISEKLKNIIIYKWNFTDECVSADLKNINNDIEKEITCYYGIITYLQYPEVTRDHLNNVLNLYAKVLKTKVQGSFENKNSLVSHKEDYWENGLDLLKNKLKF